MIIKRIEKSERLKIIDKILDLMYRIYISTNEAYPKLEWIPKEKKPKVSEENSFEKFKFYYEPFLKWRLTKELDEVFIAFENEEIIGIIALNSNVREKYVPWVPKEYRNRDDIGFIELLAVDPKYQGRGLGSTLLDMAIRDLKRKGKKPLLTTFPDLKAVKFYKKKGGKILSRLDKYLIFEF